MHLRHVSTLVVRDECVEVHLYGSISQFVVVLHSRPTLRGLHVPDVGPEGCRWLGRAQAGKALLLQKSVDTLKASITTACTAKEVSDFFNRDEILECNSTAVHPVPLLSDLPDQLVHIADAATLDQLHKLLAIAAQVVCGARCVAEDAASLMDFSLILERYPFNFAEERGVFDFSNAM